MSDRARKSADRIREKISIIRVLGDYGYQVDPRGEDREQQFPCDLHGDGHDNKPSGRVYPDSGQFFCFACARSRDAIALVQEKENLSFWDSVRFLEKKYDLESLPWSPSEEGPVPINQELTQVFSAGRVETADQILHRLNRFLDSLCKERSLDPQRCAGLWEAHDRVQFFLTEGGDSKEALSMAKKVLSAAKEALHPTERI